MPPWRASTIGLLWFVGACGAGWHREDVTPERRLPVRQQVQVWVADEPRVLHAVLIDSASVSGVPFHRRPDCDTCRVVVPRSSVDSMRLGNQERGAWRSMGLGYVALGVAALILYFSVDSD
jgi:hypothetical protein